MKPQINWESEDDIRRVFSWQTKAGIAPKAGTRPIDWYQMVHCEINDILCKFSEVISTTDKYKQKVVLERRSKNESFVVIWSESNGFFKYYLEALDKLIETEKGE